MAEILRANRVDPVALLGCATIRPFQLGHYEASLVKSARETAVKLYNVLAIMAAILLSGCANFGSKATQDPIGDFDLGYAIVVGPKMEKGPLSREIDPEFVIETLKSSLDTHFAEFKGDNFYHLSVIVEGYILSPPGVPLLMSPRSALIVKLTVWDDATQLPMLVEPHEMMIVEGTSAKTIIGSGLTQTAEEQVASLSRSAGRQIENWLRSQHKELGWFTPEFAEKMAKAREAVDALQAEQGAAAGDPAQSE